QKRVAGHAQGDDAVVIGVLDVERVHAALGRGGVAVGGPEGGEVVLAEEALGAGAHGGEVELAALAVPGVAVAQREARLAELVAVEVGLGGGGVAGAEAERHVAGVYGGEIVGQERVETA